MAVPKNVKKYLDTKMAKYDELSHKTVYTAYDAAQTLRRELREIAKSLLIATDKAYIIAVVPAHMRLDLGKLKKALQSKKISIPDEKVMVKVFKVKAGAMTAFGGLHKVEVWVDRSLLKTKEVILSAGNFTDSVRMKAKDFIELEQAKLASFTKSGGYKLQTKAVTAKKKVKKLTTRKKGVKKIGQPKVKKSPAVKRKKR
ncbi:MAG: YbaK/EbsC family protein [Patescibacteria group bacterium]|nr:YbaK/EbsC family protein [Patescibacteria group bacterium]